MGLKVYNRKRDFSETPEPRGTEERGAGRSRFVIHEHHASILHWDFRLEIGGVLKSWSVPKGPSLDPSVRRLAVQVEDHPVSYFSFKGTIPEGNYGAGVVYRWDEGTFSLEEDDPLKAWDKGALRFTLNGKRLKGDWRLFKMKGRQQDGKPMWLLQKVKDKYAVAGNDAEVTGTKDRAAGTRRMIGGKKKSQVKKTPDSDAPVVTVDEFLELRKPKGDINLEVENTRVALTSLDRIYWPKENISKYELLRYYLNISEYILPYLEDRPAILQRYPRGIGAPKFFQHDIESAPRYVKTKRMENEEGREIDYAVYTSLASLLHFVNLGTIEQHPWNSTIRRLQKPDWIVIDLDPKEAPWRNVLSVAATAYEVFEERGLNAYPKTSGSSGIHLYIPLEPVAGYTRAAKLAEEIANDIAKRIPKKATTERALAERERNQVYVDWLQNARGKSVAAPFTSRARPKATVSMPLTWDQIDEGVRITDFTIRNVPEILREQGNPWEDFFDSRQRI
jgi:bifunctional non-homologous end joining protein LigD